MQDIKLNPDWITGFVDAEGCFTVTFSKNSKHKSVGSVHPKFLIGLHKRDENLLNHIKNFFNCGNINYSKNKKQQFIV